MKNNWKYANLSENERLDMIGKGNSDVYNTEKARNKELKNLRADLGLSTDVVDRWDSMVDSANAAFNNRNKVEKPNLPKFASGRLARINYEMGSVLKDLKKQRNESINQAKTDAEQALNYIAEYLSSNGYSKDGSYSEKSRKAIEEALEAVLGDIEKNYKKKVRSTVSDFHSLL